MGAGRGSGRRSARSRGSGVFTRPAPGRRKSDGRSRGFAKQRGRGRFAINARFRRRRYPAPNRAAPRPRCCAFRKNVARLRAGDRSRRSPASGRAEAADAAQSGPARRAAPRRDRPRREGLGTRFEDVRCVDARHLALRASSERLVSIGKMGRTRNPSRIAHAPAWVPSRRPRAFGDPARRSLGTRSDFVARDRIFRCLRRGGEVRDNACLVRHDRSGTRPPGTGAR